MNYILDIIIILIIIICVIQGAKKGFVAAIISLLGVIIAFGLASFLSNICSEYVYENAVQPFVLDTLNSKTEEVLKEYNPEKTLENSLSEYFGNKIDLDIENGNELNFETLEDIDFDKLIQDKTFLESLDKLFIDIGRSIAEGMENIVPNEIVDNAKSYFDNNEHTVKDKYEMLTISKTTFAQKIESIIIKPFAIKIISYIIFSIVFALVMLIFNILGRLLKIVDYLPAINTVNSFFGGLFGALKALAFIVVIVLLCNIFIYFTGDENAVISTASIAQTYIFKWVYYGTNSLLQTFIFG